MLQAIFSAPPPEKHRALEQRIVQLEEEIAGWRLWNIGACLSRGGLVALWLLAIGAALLFFATFALQGGSDTGPRLALVAGLSIIAIIVYIGLGIAQRIRMTGELSKMREQLDREGGEVASSVKQRQSS